MTPFTLQAALEALERAIELAEDNRETGLAARVGDVRGDPAILRDLRERIAGAQEGWQWLGKKQDEQNVWLEQHDTMPYKDARPVLIINVDSEERCIERYKS